MRPMSDSFPVTGGAHMYIHIFKIRDDPDAWARLDNELSLAIE